VAAPASAGGPTSALLVVPGAGSTASLYTGDPDYEALARLVGAFDDDGAAGRVDRSGAGHETGAGVTVTWLIHDVQVWRVDRIYLDAAGGPWVSTQAVMGDAGSVWDSPVVWHTASDGPQLTALLDRLGLVSAGGAGSGNVTGSTRDTGGTAPVSPPASERPADTGSSPAAWTWGLAGLVVGAAVALAATRLVRRHDAAGPEAGPAWPLADELSSSAPRG
jgi:hypothetical protein